MYCCKCCTHSAAKNSIAEYIYFIYVCWYLDPLLGSALSTKVPPNFLYSWTNMVSEW